MTQEKLAIEKLTEAGTLYTVHGLTGVRLAQDVISALRELVNENKDLTARVEKLEKQENVITIKKPREDGYTWQGKLDLREKAVRDKLINLGWTPPNQPSDDWPKASKEFIPNIDQRKVHILDRLMADSCMGELDNKRMEEYHNEYRNLSPDPDHTEDKP